MKDKKIILNNNFINYKETTIKDLEELSQDNNQFFFDTESCIDLPNNIVEEYNLSCVDYETIKGFDDILKELRQNKRLGAKIYIWQFGCNFNDKVYWGNTIDQFIDFIKSIDDYKVKTKRTTTPYNIYVHNLVWDVEFIKYWLKQNNFKQLIAVQKPSEKKAQEKLPRVFDIVENEGVVHNAKIHLEERKIGRKNIITKLMFIDSLKITPLSLKKIGEDLIKIDDIYLKNNSNYNYNLVRNPETYKPNDIESWYQYCDIYILKEWYNQFIVPNYIDEGIKPYTISQIAFDSIIKISFAKDKAKGNYDHLMDKKGRVSDRAIYEEHYGLKAIENNPVYNEYIRNSYRGGITTTGSKYKEIAKDNKTQISGVSLDITSSYPDKCVNAPLPYGIPTSIKDGKYQDQNIFGQIYDYHFITIGFDGWHSRNKQNQFGLPIKIFGLDDKQKQMIGWSPNEYYTSNCCKLTYVGTNRPSIKDKRRAEKINKLPYKYIITITHHEFEVWEKLFKFVRYENGKRVEGVHFIDYLSFKSEVGFMAEGILHYYRLKEEGTIEGNKAKTYNAKILINSFYGKNCSKRERQQRLYNFNKDVIGLIPVDETNKNEWLDNKLYAIQYGAAITSWGRTQLMETAYKIGVEKFAYADTDSLKMVGVTKEELIEKCKEKDIKLSTNKNQKQLGGWDYEYTFVDFKAIAQKKYMYQPIDDETGEVQPFVCKCSGLPKEIRDNIKDKNQFNIGSSFIKNSKQKVVGGYVLLPTEFTINDTKIFN